MIFEVKLRKFGNSLGVILPKEALARLNVADGDKLYLTHDSVARGDALAEQTTLGPDLLCPTAASDLFGHKLPPQLLREQPGSAHVRNAVAAEAQVGVSSRRIHRSPGLC